MHDIDPYKDRNPSVDPEPAVPVTPVVNTTTGPMTPVVVETERSPSPMPWVAALVLCVLGVWGLMVLGDDRADEPERVAYVEQQLITPSPFATSAPLTTTSSRMAEDRSRDDMAELRREQMARSLEEDRLDDTTVTADYDDEVASVDLTEPAPAPAPANLDQSASTADPEPVPAEEEVTPEIAVVDLDYSNQAVTPLSEPDLAGALTQLDADIDATEEQAKEHGQAAGLEILEERLDALEDRADTVPSPMSATDLQMLTRQLNELRDELSAFQKDLAGLSG